MYKHRADSMNKARLGGALGNVTQAQYIAAEMAGEYKSRVKAPSPGLALRKFSWEVN